MDISVREIKKILEKSLIGEEEMSYGLYEYELEELISEFTASLIQDNDEFLFVTTVRINDVTGEYDTAMVLIDKSGKVYINEVAQFKLKELWIHSYEFNIKNLIPTFAKQLKRDQLPINGVKTAFQA